MHEHAEQSQVLVLAEIQFHHSEVWQQPGGKLAVPTSGSSSYALESSLQVLTAQSNASSKHMPHMSPGTKNSTSISAVTVCVQPLPQS